MHTQARWFAFHEFADRDSHFTAADVFLSALPTPFGFGLWTAHFSPAIAGARVHRVRALRRRHRAPRDRALPRDRARGGVDAVRDDAELTRARPLRPLVAAHHVHRRRDGSLRTGQGIRGPHRRARVAVLRIERDRRAVVHDPRRPAGEAAADRGPSDPGDARAPVRRRHGRRHHHRGNARRPGRERARACAWATTTIPPRTRSCSPPTAGC